MSTHPSFPTRGRYLWGEIWRSLVAVSTGLLILIALGEVPTSIYTSTLWAPIDLVLLVVWLVVMHFRRRWPFAVALILCAASTISATSVGAMTIALVSLATHRNRRQVGMAMIVAFAGGMVFQVLSNPASTRGDWITNIAFTILLLSFCVAAGAAIGARRELVASLHRQLDDAAREQVLQAAQARVAERTRIAREMHDVLAHRISLVVMHSGALAYRTDATTEEVRESSAVIRDNAQLALTELREVLGVLRDPDAGDSAAPDAPQPTLADLPTLVDQVRAADGPVTLEQPRSLEGLSELVSRNAFRIVQECLTNRRKHAHGEPVAISISAEEDDLVLEVRNPVPPQPVARQPMPSSGLGLVGLTERAVLSGGELTYGRDRSGDFVVRARLPWTRDLQP